MNVVIKQCKVERGYLIYVNMKTLIQNKTQFKTHAMQSEPSDIYIYTTLSPFYWKPFNEKPITLRIVILNL